MNITLSVCLRKAESILDRTAFPNPAEGGLQSLTRASEPYVDRIFGVYYPTIADTQGRYQLTENTMKVVEANGGLEMTPDTIKYSQLSANTHALRDMIIEVFISTYSY